MKKNMPVLTLLVSSILVLSACTPQATPAPEATEIQPAEGTTTDVAPADTETATQTDNEAVVADYTIEMGNFKFSEPEMEAEPGQTLTVKLVGMDMMHDLVIDELDVKSTQLKPGEEETVEITVPATAKSGDTYEYYCSVGEHRAKGMVGTLTVL